MRCQQRIRKNRDESNGLAMSEIILEDDYHGKQIQRKISSLRYRRVKDLSLMLDTDVVIPRTLAQNVKILRIQNVKKRYCQHKYRLTSLQNYDIPLSWH